jgi:uncharacterized protein
MLIEFSVANFRSFRELQTLRMQTAPVKSKLRSLDESNAITLKGKMSLLKSKFIFGANASGKSNLVLALRIFIDLIQHSVDKPQTLDALYLPFRLDEKSVKEPTFFQLIFLLQGQIYRYGFEVNDKEVIAEWLFSQTEKGHESYLFKRTFNKIEVNKRTFKEAVRLVSEEFSPQPLYRPNALFLPVVSRFNGEIAGKILNYISNYGIYYPTYGEDIPKELALRSVIDPTTRARVTEMLQNADIGISGLKVYRIDKEYLNIPAEKFGNNDFELFTQHQLQNGQTIEFHISEESLGTQKLFWLSPFLFSALKTGGVLVIDEFGSSLHVRLIQMIVNLFHNSDTNPNGAQLIACTHDTHLMDQSMLRRDQIAFVEKNTHGESTLIDLVEIKGVRNDASLEQDYLAGKYGGVPATGVNLFESTSIPQENG